MNYYRAAGKTQLALQLALTAQLDPTQGGLGAGVAYLTTSAFLPVNRLAEIARTHPALRGCDRQGLTDNVHNCSTTSVPALLSALKLALVQLFKHVENSEGRLKPIRVLIIDSLGSLFHSLDRTTTTTLVERSKILNEISHLIHNIASSRQAAVIVINQVTDVFNVESYSSPAAPLNEDQGVPELIYKDQSIWFSRAPPSAGLYPAREATMGLTWANQVNTRIMVSRTRRRLRPSEDAPANKRRKGPGEPSIGNGPVPRHSGYDNEEQEEVETGTLIRSLSILFSSVCSPCTMDFIIVKEGIRGMELRPESSNRMRSPMGVSTKPVAAAMAELSKSVAVPSVPLTQGFISARLTQAHEVPITQLQGQHSEDEAKAAAAAAVSVAVTVAAVEDFDTFDEEEWANYGVALGDLEEQWDAPELEPEAGNHSTSTAPSPSLGGDENELEVEVLESSDVEENFLLDNILEDYTQPNVKP